jgi:EAL domain-containing protein (putative c-di-GMP-specific phosphodiesterase class I)
VQLASRTSCTDPGSVPPRPRAGIDLSARAWRSSAITYLTIFPFEKIKIDKSFIKDVLHRSDCKAVVASTLALAQGLGIVTAAEGVETEEQFEYMRAAGVDLAQGHLFGRPVPISEFGRQTAAVLAALVA